MRLPESNGSGPTAEATLSPTITTPLTILMAAACGAIAANLYYAQPLIALIGPDIGLSPALASLVVTLTQLGYGLGLVLLVPLADILENRKLVLVAVAITAFALLLAAIAPRALPFLGAVLFIGACASVAQVLVPMAAHMADDATRGRTVGNVMGGLMIGIMFARPLAGFLSDLVGWRGVFIASSGLMLALTLLLARFLPRRTPHSGYSYGALIGSLWPILRDTPALRRRGLYQFCLFACFSLFWTSVPLELAGAPFHLSQSEIALFALAGAAGALSAPLAGRLADRGYVQIGTGLVIVGTFAAFALSGLAAIGSIAALVIAAIVIDFCVQGNTVFGQRVLYMLAPAIRGRLSGLYVAIFFMGGAVGSAIASPLYENFGWNGVLVAGLAFPLIAFAAYVTEFTAAGRSR
ncbi:putative MFS-type transporter YdeR [Kaistia sp. 32K]|uniref:MFS transporter n=1 Tax=Kaistia sp. 32K TaxID=2795690 RepID=UPI001935C37D|nr:MFS transporter [Kaistia sp. 32K]BCP54507.1 putative MFS-type transporter YdeR [Kaistia sp. 32K]